MVAGCRAPPAPSTSCSTSPDGPAPLRHRLADAVVAELRAGPAAPGRRPALDPGPRGGAGPVPRPGRRRVRRARRGRVRREPGRLGSRRRARRRPGGRGRGRSPTCTPRAAPTPGPNRAPASRPAGTCDPGRPDTSLVDPAAWRRAWRTAGSAVPGNDAGAGPPHDRLRRVLAEHLRRSRGVAVAPDDLLVVPGVGASLRALPGRARPGRRHGGARGPRLRRGLDGVRDRGRARRRGAGRRRRPRPRAAAPGCPRHLRDALAPVPARRPDAGHPPGAAARVGPAHRRPGARGRLRRRVPLRRLAAAGAALAPRGRRARGLHRHGIQAGGTVAAGRVDGAAAAAARPAAGRARVARAWSSTRPPGWPWPSSSRPARWPPTTPGSPAPTPRAGPPSSPP